MTSAIAKKLFEKVEGLSRSLILGEQLETALEMLPAGTRQSAVEAGSSLYKDGALTGSCSCNSSISLPSELRFDGAFDGGSVVNYYGSWTDLSIFDWFDTWRSSAKVREEVEQEFFTTYKNTRFQFLSYGARGERGVSFKYILKFNGFTVLFFGKPSSGELPNVQVDFSYETLRERTLFDARKEVEDFLLSIGFRWYKISFQRIDFNVTLNAPFSIVSSAFQEGRVVSRVRHWDFRYDNTSSGLVCNYVSGGDKINITIYDKFKELTRRYNEQKYDDLQHVFRDGQDLTRVEFRLKSAFLSSLDVFSFEALEEIFPSIVEYVTGEWFRILEKKKVRGKENKQVISDFWCAVRNAFFSIFIRHNDLKPLVKKRRYRFSQSRLMRQAVGCMNKALSMSYRQSENFETYLNDVFFILGKYKRLAYKQYRRKCEAVNVLFKEVRPEILGRTNGMGLGAFIRVSPVGVADRVFE